MIDIDPVVAAAFDLAPLPESASRLAALLAREDWDLDEVVDIVRLDQALTGRLLRLANSAQSGSQATITDIDAAVMRSGPGTVLSLVLGASVRSDMAGSVDSFGLCEGQLWKHSVAAALAVEKTGAITRRRPPAEAFAAALLHDIGKLILGRFIDADVVEYLTRSHNEGGEPITGAELEILQIHHGEVGALIAHHWGLPQSLIEAIQYHHDPEAATSDTGRVLGHYVQAADAVAEAIGAGAAEQDDARWTEEIEEATGLDEKSFEELCAAVDEDLAEVMTRFE